MTLIEQLNAEADKSFAELKEFVPAISHDLLLVVLKSLAIKSNSVTMHNYLTGHDLKDEKKLDDARDYLQELKAIGMEHGHVE